MSATNPKPSVDCPDDAMLAAFVDGRLSRSARTHVQQHLAQCDACYELVVETARAVSELHEGHAPQPIPVPILQFWLRPAAIAAGLAAAAVLAILLVQSSRLLVSFGAPSPRTILVEAVGAERLIEVRPTGGFKYGPLLPVPRGELDAERFRMVAATTRLRDAASAQGASVEQVHAWGVAQMLTRHYEGAIATLQTARAKEPQDASIVADLGAAQAMLVLSSSQSVDPSSALRTLDHALNLNPRLAEAWFNKALVLERVGQLDEAGRVWDRYLEIDPASAWAVEARRHRVALRRQN